MLYPPRWLAGPRNLKPRRRPRCPSARDHVMCRMWRQISQVWKRTRWSRGCGPVFRAPFLTASCGNLRVDIAVW